MNGNELSAASAAALGLQPPGVLPPMHQAAMSYGMPYTMPPGFPLPGIAGLGLQPHPPTGLPLGVVAGVIPMPPPPPPVQQRRQLRQEDALEYLNQVRRQFGDSPQYNQFLEIMREFKAQTIDTSIVIARVKELFRGHYDLILGFNTFLPADSKITLTNDPMPPPQRRPQQPEFDHAYAYVSKIKARFANQPETYREFLDILHRYQKEVRSINQVKGHVARLFRNHPDLLNEFSDFLPEPSQAQQQNRGAGGMKKPLKRVGSPPRAGPKEDKKKMVAKEPALFDRIKARLMSTNRDQYADYVKVLHLYTQGVISKSDLVVLADDILPRELCDEFKQWLGVRITVPDDRDRESSVPRGMADIDFSNCKENGASYKRLPTDYAKPACSGWHKLCEEVLNDKWVSVPSGSEDYSFKHFRKNQYEESLFKCEDDRFELDMIIESNASTIRQVAPLVDELEGMSQDDRAKFKLPKTFRVIHLRAIERIYGDNGPDVVDMLLKAPSVALPLVLPRLRQKDEEWRRARRDMNRIWKEVYEKNYHKSLDHRSFYFKQVDKKRLAAKALVQEIKEGNVAECVGVGVIELKMEASYLHDDSWQVICMGSHDTMNTAGERRLLRFWNGFFRPMMGLHGDVETIASMKKRPTRNRPGANNSNNNNNANNKGEAAAAAGNNNNNNNNKGDADVDMDRKAEGAEGEGAAKTADDEEAVQTSQTQREETAASAAPTAAAANHDKEANNNNNNDDSNNSSDEESDDSEPIDLFEAVMCEKNFRPLNTYSDPVGDDDAPLASADGSAATGASSNSRVFFGNTAFYVFLRFYNFLFERLRQARELSEEIQESRRVGGAVVVPPISREDKDNAEKKNRAERNDIYKQFFSLFSQLFDCQIDNAKFEDECRVLLGTKSYELYTLDKVVEKLLSQAQALYTEDVSRKLLDLYAYEKMRSSGVNESLYRANAMACVGDDNCFRFEFSGEGLIRMELLETSGAAATSSSKSEARNVERTRNRVIDAFMRIPEAEDDQSRSCFLRRNLQEKKKDVTQAMDGVVVQNALEWQIGLESEVLEFFPFTGDLLFRPHSKRTARHRNEEKHVAKMRAWHIRRYAEVEATPPPAEEEDDEDEEREDDDGEDGEDDEEPEETTRRPAPRGRAAPRARGRRGQK